MQDIPKKYDPSKVERKWYEYWEKHKLFHAEVDETKKPFTIVIPPPNVTGVLHMGHILNNTLQDILIRWKKMQGYNAEWLPGTDHAAIATQNVLEKKLKKEGKTKEDLGKEKFIELFWDWKEHSGGTIIKQLKYLGAACDWDREAFTMDENLTRAVQEVFIRLYKKGLIYRGKYIINWCPRCHTALSDDETEYKDKKSHLWYIRYPFVDEPDKYIVVATTRPETMLGDTAVAVNPKDERYSKYIGRKLRLPYINREIPIIADTLVDPEFGTGCVKVTPAHDPNDFEMGNRHNLERVVVINTHGVMNENAGDFKGLDRFEARKKLVEWLKENGFLEKIEDYEHSVGHCYRCDTVIEPYLSEQWFVKMEPIAKPAIKAIENDEIRFFPNRWKKVALNWLYNIRDWCISRQIWLGHKIPIWYCENGHVQASIDEPSFCPECDSKKFTQDQDVLDTWFSSWLWPFSTFGWPEKTKELEYFYPTDTLVTDPGILFFWVVRMIIAGFEFMGKKPFTDVHLHGVVCDELGRKMSKSLGNSPDPLELIAKYSADAVRFSIIFSTPPGQNTLFSEKQTEMGRNFTNKIWNAFRLLLMNVEHFDISNFNLDFKKFSLADKWILHKLNQTTKEINYYLKEYKFNEAEHSIYDFIWKSYCDWYLEIAKQRWYKPESEYDANLARYLAIFVLYNSIKLLHPFMPFLTEQIWQILKEKHLLPEGVNLASIMVDSYPQFDDKFVFETAVEQMNLLINTIIQIRNIRAEKNIKPKDTVNVIFEEHVPLFDKNQKIIKNLAKVGEIRFNEELKEQAAVGIVDTYKFFIPLAGLVDTAEEKEKLQKEIQKLESYLTVLNKKLHNENFLSKAPEHVVEQERKRFKELSDKLKALKESLEELS